MQRILSCAHRAVVPMTAATSCVGAGSRRITVVAAAERHFVGLKFQDTVFGQCTLPSAVWAQGVARARQGHRATLTTTPVVTRLCLQQQRALHATVTVAAAPKSKSQKREEETPPPPASDEEASDTQRSHASHHLASVDTSATLQRCSLLRKCNSVAVAVCDVSQSGARSFSIRMCCSCSGHQRK